MNVLYVLLHEMCEAGDSDSPARGLYVAMKAKKAQDSREPKDAKDPLRMGKVRRDAELIPSHSRKTAQGHATNVSSEKNSESSHESTILSDLSNLSMVSSFTAADAGPICGGREWRPHPRGTRIGRACLYQANWAGLRLDEWAELENERWAREAETEVRRVMGWYATDCARCQRPLWDRTADAILAGAELCAECDLPLQDLQWLRE